MRITVVDLPDLVRFELRLEDEVVGRAGDHVADGAMNLPYTEVDPGRHGQAWAPSWFAVS